MGEPTRWGSQFKNVDGLDVVGAMGPLTRDKEVLYAFPPDGNCHVALR